MKVLIEGTIGEFLEMVEDGITVPLTVNFGKRVGTAIVHRNGMIEGEIDDEAFAEKIRAGMRGGYSIGN